MGASYCGGVAPYYETVVGLGVKGAPFYSSYHGGCPMTWTFCGALDMDAGVVAPEGGRMVGSTAGTMAAVMAFSLGCVGGER